MVGEYGQPMVSLWNLEVNGSFDVRKIGQLLRKLGHSNDCLSPHPVAKVLLYEKLKKKEANETPAQTQGWLMLLEVSGENKSFLHCFCGICRRQCHYEFSKVF